MPSRRDWTEDESRSSLLARNLASDYVAIAVDIGLGIALLPFNIAHLGESAYGLWMLAVSITTYFSILSLGYGSSQVKFTAQYRALRDADSLNEIVSTLFFLFLAIAALVYGAALLIAANLERLFELSPEQLGTGQVVLLIVSAYVALGLPFSVFGGVVNGFQRYYLNNRISVVTSLVAALGNVIALLMGFGLVELVAVTTTIRILAFAAYRRNAYRVFPPLSISWRHVNWNRLRQITAFSSVLFVIDIAAKINMASDTLVVGAFLGTSAVAVWAVATRFSRAIWTLTHVLSRFLFPTIVESATQGRIDRLRTLYLEGTRLSLALVIPGALITALLAEQLLRAWVGPRFTESTPLVWLLAAIVVVRIGMGTGTSVLKGGGLHRLLAGTSIAIALSNLALSIVLIQRTGLVGVAVGTLVPVAGISLLIVFPAACRRVQLSIPHVLRVAVWPAVWPAGPAGAAVWAMRPLASTHPLVIVLVAVTGMMIYAGLFLLVGLRADERRWYFERVAKLRRSRQAQAA